MEKLTTLTGVGVPLRRSNVDTDQTIPAKHWPEEKIESAREPEDNWTGPLADRGII